MKNKSIVIYIVMCISAFILILSFWIPFMSANSEQKDLIDDNYGDYLYYLDEETSISYDYLEYLSPQKFCNYVINGHEFLKKYENEVKQFAPDFTVKNDLGFIDDFAVLFAIIFTFSLLITLFIILKRYIPVIVFSFLNLAAIILQSYFIHTYCTNYNLSIGLLTYLISTITILVCSFLKPLARKVRAPQFINNPQNNNAWSCPNCNNIVYGNFCNICGYKRALDNSKKYCPNCGKSLPIDVNFCANCGKKF